MSTCPDLSFAVPGRKGIHVAPTVIGPEVPPQVQPEVVGQLPTTGWSQLPLLLLAAGLFVLLGLIALTLGMAQLRGS